MTWLVAIASVAAAAPAGLRWLRVAQREHYLAPAATRFALRWWRAGPVNPILLAAALTGVVGSQWESWLGLLAPITQVGPIGLGVRGRTSPLAWTARLRRLAAVSALLFLAAVVAGALADLVWLVAAAVVALPLLVDLGDTLLAPGERRLGRRWVDKAAARLRASGARVVAITGSYGKTTTKQYLAHLLSGTMRVVASPASFNNRMGLARAINEHLVPGTEVFVAEMGTYGPGEIAALVRWIPPDVSALVALGPVHLERMGSEERILRAKAEIFTGAEVGVLCVDHPLLAGIADRVGVARLITTSGDGAEATVTVRDGVIYLEGAELGPVPAGVLPGNLAAAVGICHALGVDAASLPARFPDLPRPEHRQATTTSERGFTIIDDTFNANPAGARRGLAVLADLAPEGRRVVVTPGMVELGPRQFAENQAFAAEAARVAHDLVIVGRTNRRALLAGAAGGEASVTVLPSREEAVAWVRARLGPGDAVLYENDLPDHYP